MNRIPGSDVLLLSPFHLVNPVNPVGLLLPKISNRGALLGARVRRRANLC
jgi:hypothetical protein